MRLLRLLPAAAVIVTALALFCGPARALEKKVRAPDGAEGDLFGEAVALSDDGVRMVAGAYHDEVDGKTDAGSASVFSRAGNGDWVFECKLVAKESLHYELFGQRVAMSGDGNFVIASAGLNGDYHNVSGRAHVFRREENATWTEEGRLTVVGRTVTDGVGATVDISGDGQLAFLGAYADNGNTGAAFVFARAPGGTWTLEATLEASDAAPGNWFSDCLSASNSGQRLVVGASQVSTSALGKAYIFSRTAPGVWSEDATLVGTAAGATLARAR